MNLRIYTGITVAPDIRAGRFPRSATDCLPLANKWTRSHEFEIPGLRNEKRISRPNKVSYDFATRDAELARDLNTAFGKSLWAESGGTWSATLNTDSREFWECHHFFAKNGWFEFQVLSALRQAVANQKNKKWNPEIAFAHHFGPASRIEDEMQTFELDVAAIFGYQLVSISCTFTRKEHTKEKAFEALFRARQLGGMGARAIVIRPQEEDADRYEQSLQWDIGLDPNMPHKPLEIWGNTKAQHMQDWFETYLANL